MTRKALPLDTGPIRVLIVDDEPLARQTVRVLLREDPDVEVVGECANGRQAVEALQAQPVDLVFLDVQMPGMTGLEVIEAIGPAQMPVIIFTTAYDHYALRAFEVHALDYLLKPFDDDRFEAALGRAKAQVRQRTISELSQRLFSLLEDPAPSRPRPEGRPADTRPMDSRAADSRSPEGRYLTRIMIKGTGPIVFLKVDEIDWIEAADYYAELHVGGKTHLLRESLKSLEERLDPDLFMRIHRSTIVNLDRVQRLQPDARGDYEVVLRDGTAVRLGRGRKEELQARLTGLALEGE